MVGREGADETVTTIETIGSNVKTVWSTRTLASLCGPSGVRASSAFCHHYYQDTNGLTFVVDSNGRDSVEEAKAQQNDDGGRNARCGCARLCPDIHIFHVNLFGKFYDRRVKLRWWYTGDGAGHDKADKGRGRGRRKGKKKCRLCWPRRWVPRAALRGLGVALPSASAKRYVGWRTGVDRCRLANCMSGLHGVTKMSLSDRCEKVTVQINCCRELHHCRASAWICSRFRVFQPVEIQTSKLLLILVISRPEGFNVSPSLRNTTTSIKYRMVFMCSKITHEVFLWSCASHVIHVTQEDRIIMSLFLHVRPRKTFLQIQTLEESIFASGAGSTYIAALVIDGTHCDNFRKQNWVSVDCSNGEKTL